MSERIRLLWMLLLITAVVMLSGIAFIYAGILPLPLSQLLVLVHSAFAISFLSGMIFLAGENREGKDRVFLTLVSIGSKFLLYLIFILLWRIFSKNLTKPFIITFFVLYLVFTFFLVLFFHKRLKNN